MIQDFVIYNGLTVFRKTSKQEKEGNSGEESSNENNEKKEMI